MSFTLYYAVAIVIGIFVSLKTINNQISKFNNHESE
jgi:uncharacterized protein YneF (UPF0154 family)